MKTWLIDSWQKKNLITYFLLPFSLLYGLVVTLRYWLYRCNILKSFQSDVPIIVVGNITVGGTGKTPLVIWLANFLKENGYQPGVVSRGYGGKAKQYPQQVNFDSDPTIVGDEALLIIQKTNCPMMVSPNRVSAVKTLLNNHYCDVVISDDGLQHYALARDLEIAVIDGERRFGNEYCLPAGPLREPKKRLNDVNFAVSNGRALLNEYSMNLVPDSIYNLLHPEMKLDLKNSKTVPIHAVAGIGNPQRFFQVLRAMSFNIIEHPFPDHYFFKKADFQFNEDAIIIMTEKDAVKCRDIADHRFWCLPVKVDIDAAFGKQILNQLQNTYRSSYAKTTRLF